jgi:hypothetical protein
MVIVSDVAPTLPEPSRDRPLPVPAGEPWFTLAELGLDDQTVRGVYAPSIVVPLRFEGNSQPREDTAELFLEFAYGAQVDPRRSLVEIRLNGIPLRSWALDDSDGAERQRLRLALPEALLEPASVLEFAFRLVPLGKDSCVQIRDRHLWATVFDTTELHVPRDRFAWLPDLGRLQFDFWPYGRDLREGVVLILPDLPGPGSISAAANLAAHLGRVGVEDPPWLSVSTGDVDSLQDRPERHAILLVDNGTHGIRESLIAAGHLSALSADPHRTATWSGTVQQIRHPWIAEGTVLEIAAPNDRLLGILGDELRTRGRQQHMEETAVVFDAEGSLVHFQNTPRQRVGSLHAITAFRLGAERAYLLVGLGVIVAGALFSSRLRRWAAVRGGTF